MTPDTSTRGLFFIHNLRAFSDTQVVLSVYIQYLILLHEKNSIAYMCTHIRAPFS